MALRRGMLQGVGPESVSVHYHGPLHQIRAGQHGVAQKVWGKAVAHVQEDRAPGRRHALGLCDRRLECIRRAGQKVFRRSVGLFVHIAEIHEQNAYNVQESLNGEIKPLLCRRGGFKITNSPLIGLAILGYNFFRPHAALGGKTPAKAAGICGEGDDPILTLLEAAAA